MRLFVLLASIFLAGCSVTDRNGVRRSVVLGFGYFSYSTNNPAATVYKSNQIGLGGGTMPGPRFWLGWSKAFVTEVPATTNITLEIR